MPREYGRRSVPIILLLGTFLFAHEESRANVYIEPQIAQALIRRGVPAARVAEVYPHVLRGIGESARAASRVARHISPRMAAEVGLVFADHPPVRARVVELILKFPGANAAELAAYLERGPLSHVIARSAPAQFREEVLNIAYRLTQEGSSRSLRQAVTTEAAAGTPSLVRQWLGRLGSRLGTALEWLASKTAQRFFGAVTIAEFTQSQINEALEAFQDEMEAVGDAAEAEAFNNNLQLVIDSLRDRRSVLAPGMTFAKAVRQLRKNMNRGGRIFAGILVKPGSPPDSVPPGRQTYVYVMAKEWVCCKDPATGETPKPIRVGPVDPRAPGVTALRGPFDTRQEAVAWLCNREIAWPPGPWASNYARVDGVSVANLPCPRTR